MENISISVEPNQVMTVSRDGVQFDISLRSYAGITLASITKDGESVANSLPCVRNGWLIPYEYLVGSGGNFRFESTSEAYPTYDGFGTLYQLVYYTNEEYLALKEQEG